MREALKYLAFLVVLGIIIVIVYLVLSGPAGAINQPSLIRVIGIQASRSDIDTLPRGPSGGDIYYVRYNIYNWRTRIKPIGRAEALCIAFDSIKVSCNATFYFPRGLLLGLGTIPIRNTDFGLVIIGGTGFYANARGKVTVKQIAATRPPVDRVTFTLEPA